MGQLSRVGRVTRIDREFSRAEEATGARRGDRCQLRGPLERDHGRAGAASEVSATRHRFKGRRYRLVGFDRCRSQMPRLPVRVARQDLSKRLVCAHTLD